MKFKNYYNLERMDWPFSKDGAISEKISAKYKKGVVCRLSVNKKNENMNVNVFAESELIGFINHPYSSVIAGALDNEEKLHSELVEVKWENGSEVVPESVVISVSSYPRKPKGVKGIVKPGYKEKGNPIDPGDAGVKATKEILPQRNHYILGIPFSEQRKKKIPIKSLSGKRGIYCIWNKTHETYIGQSQDIGRRVYQHCEALWTKQHANNSLQMAWEKGHSNFRFDVVKELSNGEDLDHWEKYYIETYKTFTNGFNSTPDGLGRPSEKVSVQQPKKGKNIYPDHDLYKQESAEPKKQQMRPSSKSSTTPDGLDRPSEKVRVEHPKKGKNIYPDHDLDKQEPAEPKKYQMRPSSKSSTTTENKPTKEEESSLTSGASPSDIAKFVMFVDCFDGRYYKNKFKRATEDGIVRITVLDEIWCYRVGSQYYAEKLVQWFAAGRDCIGAQFDYTIYP